MMFANVFQPAHNDKTAHPEVARLMKELIKSCKQLKGKLLNQKYTYEWMAAMVKELFIHKTCQIWPLKVTLKRWYVTFLDINNDKAVYKFSFFVVVGLSWLMGVGKKHEILIHKKENFLDGIFCHLSFFVK